MNNFPIANKEIQACGELSNNLLEMGIQTLHTALHWTKHLPYGRNTDRSDYRLVLTEKKGTCSTKHALLAALFNEQRIKEVELFTGIYKMNETNTPGVGKVLAHYNLSFLPEAHCYLSIQGVKTDLTRKESNFQKIRKDVLNEIKIEPSQIGTFKVRFHKDFISRWLIAQKLPYTSEELWAIREACIKALDVS